MEGVEDLVITVEADAPALLRALLALEDRVGEGETATALRAAGEALMTALDALARWDASGDLTDEEVERRIAVEEERSRQEYLEEHAREGQDDAPQGEGPLH